MVPVRLPATRVADDSRPESPECAAPLAPRAFAFRYSIHRSARAFRAPAGQGAGSPETRTYPCTARRKGAACPSRPGDPQQLMPGDASGLASAARARCDHEIVAAGPDRLDQTGDAARIVRAVAVHEHHDVGILGRHDCREARPAVAAPGTDNVGTRGFRPRNSGVGAAAICHDDAGYDGTRDTPHHLRDRLLLVERRYHDDDATRRGFAPSTIPASRIHRSKAPAQAAVGTGGGRLVRQKRFAERTVGRAVPNLLQRLLGGIAQGVMFVAAL